MIIYRKNTFAISKPKDPNVFWAYQLPFIEKLRGFKTFKEAKDYVDECIKEEEKLESF